MKVAIPNETQARERRVAPIPETLPKLALSKLTAGGFEATVSAGADRHVFCPYDAHHTSGAQLRAGDVMEDAAMVLSVQPLTRALIALTEHDSPMQTVRTP